MRRMMQRKLPGLLKFQKLRWIMLMEILVPQCCKSWVLMERRYLVRNLLISQTLWRQEHQTLCHQWLKKNPNLSEASIPISTEELASTLAKFWTVHLMDTVWLNWKGPFFSEIGKIIDLSKESNFLRIMVIILSICIQHVLSTNIKHYRKLNFSWLRCRIKPEMMEWTEKWVNWGWVNRGIRFRFKLINKILNNI